MTLDEAHHILLVDLTFTDEEVKRAWRCRVQQFHPDREPGYEREFQQVHEAYRMIMAYRQALPSCLLCGDTGAIARHTGFAVLQTICVCKIKK